MPSPSLPHAMLAAVSPLFLALIGLAACGGDVVVDDEGSTGSGGSSASGPSGSGASAPAGTGAVGPGPSGTTGPGPGAGGSSVGCVDHAACPPGSACIFSIGECAELCQGECEGCGPGTTCNACATSSCQGCDDCVGACLPTQKGQCDSDDACAPGSLCYFPDSTCHTPCSQFEPSTCPPGEACVGCATGSCCGCEDCVDLCLPAFDAAGP